MAKEISNLPYKVICITWPIEIETYILATLGEWQFWLAVVLGSSNTMPFGATKERLRSRYMPIAHAQLICKRRLQLFAYGGCVQGPYGILHIQSNVWWLMIASRNFY